MRPLLVAAAALAASFSASLPAQAAITIQIVKPPDGATVRGVVQVEAASDPTVTSVSFDWSADGGATWQPIPSGDTTGPSWTTAWDTAGHSGPAILRATGTDGATTVSDTASLSVDNIVTGFGLRLAATAFSPDGDGRKETAEIAVDLGEPADVVVAVLGAAGAERRSWSVSGPGPHVITWDGKDGSGALLPDGRYLVRARAQDAAGNAALLEASLAIDTANPWARVADVRPQPASGRRPIVFRIRTIDASEQLRATLRIVDRAGRTVAERAFELRTGNDEVRWRPRRPKGAPLYPGQYVARLLVVDEAANASEVDGARWRVLRRAPGRVFHRVRGAGKLVAITIDDCHYEGAWASMLRTLKRMRVRATFFCPGDRMLLFPELTRRTVRQGHIIASHGWDHAALAGRGFSQTAWRLRKDERIIWRLTRTSAAPYFRPPYGSYDGSVVAAAGATGHPRVMMWDVSTGDTGRPGAGAIARNAVSGARRGSVILMHTIDQTAAALPAIIRGLRNKGLKPVGLPELFRAAGMPA